jgi:hypothetical protein
MRPGRLDERALAREQGEQLRESGAQDAQAALQARIACAYGASVPVSATSVAPARPAARSPRISISCCSSASYRAPGPRLSAQKHRKAEVRDQPVPQPVLTDSCRR